VEINLVASDIAREETAIPYLQPLGKSLQKSIEFNKNHIFSTFGIRVCVIQRDSKRWTQFLKSIIQNSNR